MRYNTRYWFLFICTLVAVYILVYYFNLNKSSPYSYDTLFKSNTDSQSCVPPKLDPFSPKMMSFYKPVQPITCPASLDWVEPSEDGSFLQITREAEEMYGPVSCDWTDVLREGDFKVNLSSKKSLDVDRVASTDYKLNMSDHVLVNCKGREGSTWKNVVTGLRPVDKRAEKGTGVSKTLDEKLNVIILGIDSMSQHNFARMLKNTSRWLQDHGAVFLSNYNVMGDGTVAALAPLLTGLKEWELPETRRRMKDAQPCDNLPFIWKQFSEAGYVTSFVEDAPSIGTFTYRLTGFNSSPTNHYMRTYYMAQQTLVQHPNKYCYHATPRHMVNLNHVRQLYQKYPNRKKFFFSWASELSHDDTNMIQAADKDLVSLFSQLAEDGSLKDTLLILMADHGHRFDVIRNTFQGKLEERMPLLSLLFPESFQRKYPQAYSNIKRNAARLTTALDIHATLKDILELDGKENTVLKSKTGTNPKSISLFRPIPEKRSCSDASIEPHWCACLNWAKLDTNSDLAKDAANFLLAYIISFTAEKNHRDICHVFSLGSIMKASLMAPKKDVLKFQKSVGQDAESADMNGSSDLEELWVQVQVILQPGNAIFDSTLKYKVVEKLFSLEGNSSVSRISPYQGQADCMADTSLRQWCYCRMPGL